MRRVLLLVPHPDDQVVACAAAVTRARGEGICFFAVYLTTGVSLVARRRRGYQTRVTRRRDEALPIARTLGIEPAAFSPCPARRLHEHLDDAHRLVCLLVIQFGIDGVWAPARQGGHPDHDSASLLASRLAGALPVIELSLQHPRVDLTSPPGARHDLARFAAPDGQEG